MLADDRADRAKQLQLLQILGEVRRPACVAGRASARLPVARQRAADGRPATLAGYDDPAIAGDVIKAYANMSDDVLAAAQSLLVTRRAWAARFLEAIEAQTIDPRTVLARSSRSCCCWATRESADLTTRLFGPIKPATSAELHAQIDRLAAVVRAGSGVPKPGKQIFDQQCAAAIPSSAKGARSGPT